MEKYNEAFDPKDIDNSKEKILNETAPCNIFGLIGKILERLDNLEKKINEVK